MNANFIFHDNRERSSSICGIPNPFSREPSKVHRPDDEENEVENFLAASMNKLSVQDREKVLEDVHGVAKEDPEEESTVISKLSQLEAHLLVRKRGTAYELAENIDQTYTTNHDFRMKFLRGNDYDPRSAAEQMLKFFDMKHSLFGVERLTQRITLDSLDAKAKQCLQAGYIQLMEPRDAVSRQILVCLPGLKLPEADVETEVKAAFYFVWSALESIEAQKRGLVAILYSTGQYKDQKKSRGAARLAKVALSVPLRFCSIHICCSDPVEYLINQTGIRMFPAPTAAKIRIHLGSHVECQYALRGYGIPTALFPMSSVDFSPDITNHRRWYQQRMEMEAEWKHAQSIKRDTTIERDDGISLTDGGRNDESERRSRSPNGRPVIQPQLTDVLFGKGYMMHPGNIQMRHMVTENSQGYELASGKHQKIEAAGQLVDQMKSNGVRFLVYDKGSERWTIATNAQARNKVAKTIRNRRRAKTSST